jgi:radical SAM protein with 4Fe4S-binding SPASM domain
MQFSTNNPGYKIYAKVATALFRLYDTFFRPAFPPVVRIESTNICNASCTTCPRDQLTRKFGVMDFDLFQKIIDECAAHKTHRIHLHNFGEPLIDRELTKKISYAKDRGMKVRVFSNLSLLTEELAQGLVSSGLDDIKISFDGYTKETFENIRRKLKFEDVVHNIRLLIDTKNRMGSSTPKVGLTFVETPENSHEKELFLEEWKGMADNTIITKYHNWGGKVISHAQAKLIPCPRIWSTLTVLWNGDVALCCLDFDGSVILGNVRTQSIADIYQSDKINDIRNYHLTWQYSRIPICSDCSLRK